jgi:hypothetical protein
MEVEICDIVRRNHANSPERRAFCPRRAVRHDAAAHALSNISTVETSRPMAPARKKKASPSNESTGDAFTMLRGFEAASPFRYWRRATTAALPSEMYRSPLRSRRSSTFASELPVTLSRCTLNGLKEGE